MFPLRKLAGCLALLSGAVQAAEVVDLGDVAKLTLSGFIKAEGSTGNNLAKNQTNCVYTPDPRGVLGTFPDGAGPFCQAGESGRRDSTLGLGQFTAELAHEFDSAWSLASRTSVRLRNGKADIPGATVVENNLAVSHPQYGELRLGRQLSRSWSRSDSFSYPIGISSQWSETGSGYSVLNQSVRYTTPSIPALQGKWVSEVTLASNNVRYAANAAAVGYDEKPPKPWLGEVFVQYAPTPLPMLIEYIFQGSRGGLQSSWAKGNFVGDVGNADNLPNYRVPSQTVHILQGDYYPTPQTKITAGARRNQWSGAVMQCDYAVAVGGCTYPAGFNYASDLQTHKAVSYDFMGGASYFDGPWTYHTSVVRLNKAYTKTPTEYGQSNTATYLNLGFHRKLPELHRGLSVYGGVGYVMFGRQGPAPLSMPSNLAWGVDPRRNNHGMTFTVGLNWVL